MARALLITAAACALAVTSLAFFDVIITLLSVVAILMALFYGLVPGLASFILILAATIGVTLFTPLVSETLNMLTATSLQISTGLNLALGLLALAFAGRLRSRFKRTLAESAERELRYRSLLEASPDAIIQYDRDGYYREAFQPSSFRGIQSATEIKDRHVSEVLPAEVARQLLGKIEHAFVTGKLQTLEHPLMVAGELRYREVRLTAMNDHEIMAVVRDITEQTRQAQRLRESGARNRALLEVIPDALIRYDRKGYYRQAFQPSSFTTIWSASEIEDRHVDEILPAEVAQQLLGKIEQAFVTGELQTLEHPLMVAGELRHREVRLVAMNDHEGIAVVRDITEQTRQAQQLRESEARNRALLAAIPDAIICLGRDGRYLDVIPPTEFTLRDPNAAAEGRTIHDTLSAEIAAETQEKLARAFATGELQVFEHSLRVQNETQYREARFVRVNDREVIAIVHDITKRKQAELAIIEANRHKSEFLATMSHELRTPLTSILGFSEILTEQYFGPLNDKQAEYVRDIHGSGQHLLSLINDILDLSKVEAGKLELHPETIDLQNMAESALRIVGERAQQQGLRLTHKCSGILTPVRADARKLRQMLFNYLSNAVKFTPEGGSVTLNIEGTDDEVRFEVTDTGVGIAQEDQAKLFKSFSQIDSSLTRSHMGTGLGLALVKQLAELHGGTVWVRSEVGVGSTFGFSVARGLSGTDDAARVVA